MTTLVAQDLEVGYSSERHAQKALIGPVTLTLQPASLTCLLGPNGIGKSTLLRTLAGLQPALAGRVKLGTVPLDALSPRQLAQHLSLVLTERAPVGSLSLWSLVGMGRYPHTDWRGHLTAEDNAVIARSLSMMGLEALAHRPMNTLSDGERQKAMIARALAQEPQIMLLDEATAFLDLPRRVEVMQLLQELARNTSAAILLSSHDLDLTLRYADRLWLISRDGKIRGGIPEDLVLNGGFEATFADASISFDPYTAAFVPTRAPRASVSVKGEELTRLWAERALERVGFEVVHENSDWQVTLSPSQQSLPDWRLEGRAQVAGHGLESLLSAIESQG
jgi:iron complex transport system ATP-binding protein